MKTRILIGVAVLGLASTSAQAQDVSGFRIEGRLGWGQTGAEATVPNPEDDEDETGDEFLVGSEKDSEVAYGFELGYDAQIGESLVLGAYAGLDLSDTLNCSELIADDLACWDSGRTFTLGVRAGVPIGSNSLIYAKGGYSNGKFGASYDPDLTDNDDEEPGEVFNFSEKRDGYHLGAGAEFGITKGLYGKLEYVYSDFGSSSYALDEDGDTNLDVSSDRHQVLVGVGMRF
jgi:outer membrane immunogenic protein